MKALVFLLAALFMARESFSQADIREGRFDTIMGFLSRQQMGVVMGFTVDYPDTKHFALSGVLFSDGRINLSPDTSGVYIGWDKPEILDKKMTVNFVKYWSGQAEAGERGDSLLRKMRFEITLEDLEKEERGEKVEFLLTVVDGSHVLDELRFMARNPVSELFAVKTNAAGYELPEIDSKVSDRDVTHDLWKVVDIAHGENNNYWLKGLFFDSEMLWFRFEDVGLTEKDYSWLVDCAYDTRALTRIYYSPDKDNGQFYDLDLPKGTIVAILRKSSEYWFLLFWNEKYDVRKYGWINTLEDGMVFRDGKIDRLLGRGVLNDDRVRVRTEPNLSGEIRGFVNRGDKVEILEIGQKKQKIDGMESVWYKVRTGAKVEGWVFGEYVDITE